MFTHISPHESWKIGYYTKENGYNPTLKNETLPEWEYWEAVLRTHLSELCHMTATELGYDNWDVFKYNIPELTTQ